MGATREATTHPAGTPADTPARAPVVAAPAEGDRRAWRAVLTAAAVSSTGDGLAAIAFPLLAIAITRDPRLIAGVAVASRLPWLLSSLPAGAIVDRSSIRRVVGFTESARTALLLLVAGAAVLHVLSLPLIYLVAFAVGTCETAFAAAMQATIPAVVAEDDLARANGHMYAAQLGGELFLGPALGGLAYAVAPALPFAGDAVSFAVCGAVLGACLPRRVAAALPERPGTGVWADMTEGLRWFCSHRLLRLLAGLVASMAFFQAMVNGVAVVYAVEELHLSKAGFGLFLALGSAGNIVGGLVAGRVKERWGTGQVLLAAGCLAAGSYVVIGTTSAAAVAVLAYIVESLVVVLGNVANLSLRQALVPTELRGRASNVFRTAVYGAIPLGAAAGGLLAHATGVRAAIVIAGAAQLGVLALAARPLSRELALHRPAPATAGLAPAA